MDIALIQAGLESFKTAKDIIKTLMELKEFATHQGKLGELNAALVAAYGAALEFQAKAATLIAEKGELEKEIMDLKAWETEAQRYELHKVTPCQFVHLIKETMRGPEPVHWICSHCYQERVKSILQFQSEGVATQRTTVKTYLCSRCKNTIRTTHARQ